MNDLDLAYSTVAELVDGLRSKEYSVREITKYFLDRIDHVDPIINAWVTVGEESSLKHALELDNHYADHSSKPLYGIPVGVKDLTQTAGMRTTFGSTLFRENVPTVDAAQVRRLREAGAVIVGKTNTPEFGFGCNTFNLVSGATRNPWDLDKTAGGSSGGSAAALAAGMCTLADGSDFGGSIRVPAAYCGVVGLRPTPGMTPVASERLLWDTHAVSGPMARTLEDLEAMLMVLAGPDPGAPLSMTYASSAPPLSETPRVAFTIGRDLIDVDAEVERSLRWAIERLEEVGCRTTEASPPLSSTPALVRELRAVRAASQYGELLDLDNANDFLNPGLLADIERGLRLPPTAAITVEEQRSAIYQATIPFWEQFDILVLPSVPIPPFSVEEFAPTRIGADQLDLYSDWMILTTAISLMGWPVLAVPSLPAGGDQQPLGIQLVGPPGSDRRLLELGRRYERVADWRERFPPTALRK